MALVAAAAIPSADRVSFTAPQFEAASPQQRIVMVIAALPAADRPSAKDIALPVRLTMDADADGWFMSTTLYAKVKRLPGTGLCERRVTGVSFHPKQSREYPMSQASVRTQPLLLRWSGTQAEYLRPKSAAARVECPSTRDAPYTIAPDAATALRVFAGLDTVLAATAAGDTSLAKCGSRDGPRPCDDAVARLRSLTNRAVTITPQPRIRMAGADIVYSVANDRWYALMGFAGTRVVAVELSITAPPPVA